MSDRKIAVAIYAFCTLVYALVAGQRLLRPSNDTHFVYQAQCFLQRRLDLATPPPHSNDWAEVDTLTLRDGTQVTGHALRGTPDRFRLLDGRVRSLADSDITARSRKHYVSFPPFPAVLMLPAVALFGMRTNDVLFTVLLAGVAPALLFLLLRRLPAHLAMGAPDASPSEPAPPPLPLRASLLLTLLLAFGSSYFFCSVLGQVWFTAHVVSMLLCAVYLGAIWGRWRPFVAGVCVGALFLTRPQMAALGVLFVAELVRRHDALGRYVTTWASLRQVLSGAGGRLWAQLAWFALPSATLFGLGAAHNVLRFGRVMEFGHTYLTTMQADNIQRFGLFNYQYLPRNLATALALLPKLLATPPFVQISYHGLALWFTTPALFFLLWPQPGAVDQAGTAAHAEANRRALSTVIALSVAPIIAAALLYQNTGYVQFGYRFSLDYTLPLVALLALTQGHRLRITSPADRRRHQIFCALLVWGVLVNLFGAVTFSRHWQFYFNGFFPVP